MKKLNLEQFLKKRERTLIVIFALLAIFPILQNYGKDYAGYFAIATATAVFILMMELTKENEELEVIPRILHWAVGAMVFILLALINKEYSDQVHGALGLVLLIVPGIFSLTWCSDLVNKAMKKNKTVYSILFLIIGITMLMTFEQTATWVMTQLPKIVLPENTWVALVLTSILGGIALVFGMFAPLLSLGNLFGIIKVKWKKIKKRIL